MAFPLPPGLQVVYEVQAPGDDEVAAVEEAQPSGTRMLVALGFPGAWPGFLQGADLADWAARSIAGLQPWPEVPRVVMADPHGEAIWWVAYRSSPAWWVPILVAIGLFLLAAASYRVVRVVAPEIVAPIETTLGVLPALLPLALLALIMSSLATLMPSGGRR